MLKRIQPSVNSILIDKQYGFRLDRSAITSSLVFNNFIHEAFENCLQVDTIYTDLFKAFDRVDQSTLLQVLYKSGFGDPLLSWIKSYLTDRTQWAYGHKSAASAGTIRCSSRRPFITIIVYIFFKRFKTNTAKLPLSCFCRRP